MRGLQESITACALMLGGGCSGGVAFLVGRDIGFGRDIGCGRVERSSACFFFKR